MSANKIGHQKREQNRAGVAQNQKNVEDEPKVLLHIYYYSRLGRGIIGGMVGIEEVFGGYSGARLLRLRTGEQDYCIKILPERLSEGSAARVKRICEIYRRAGIDSLSLRGYGNLEAENRHFYIYDYIEGESFKEYSNRELSLTEIRAAGAELGRKLRTLKLDKKMVDSASLAAGGILAAGDSLAVGDNLATGGALATDDIEKLTEYGVSLYRELMGDAEVAKLMREYFDLGQIEELMEGFRATTKVFLGMEPGLIHGDLKRSNVVRGSDGKNYLIDIESMRRSYDVLNLRYQMSWIMFPGAEREREFVGGVFDGMYEGSGRDATKRGGVSEAKAEVGNARAEVGDGKTRVRPEGFDKQLEYVLMLNFVEHTMKARRRGEDLREYFGAMREVFTGMRGGWAGL